MTDNTIVFYAADSEDDFVMVSACLLRGFVATGYLSDQFSATVNDKMTDLGFYEIMESTYEPGDETLTLEQVNKILLDGGLVQTPEFTAFMESHT